MMNHPSTGGIGVLGYSACRGCGDLHPSLLLQRLGGRCQPCIDAKLGEIAVTRARVGGVVVPLRAKKRHKRYRGDETTRKSAERARMSASRRLREHFPDLYQAILAQERVREGLEPFPLESAAAKVAWEGLEADVRAALQALRAPEAYDRPIMEVSSCL